MLVNQKSKLRRRIKLGAIAFSVIGLLVGAVYVVWFSPLFEVRAIDVEGARLTDKAVIGGEPGGNMLIWKPPVDILGLPTVATLDIEKRFLERRVILRIVESEKTLIWCLENNGDCFWTDGNGMIFSDAPNPQGSLLIKAVRDYSDRNLELGDRVLDGDFFQNLKSVFELLNGLEVPVKEMRIDKLEHREVIATIKNGPEIHFSLDLDPAFGEGVIESLMTSGKWNQIRYIDLRVKNRAYYSL